MNAFTNRAHRARELDADLILKLVLVVAAFAALADAVASLGCF